jgi:hypothetical protein
MRQSLEMLALRLRREFTAWRDKQGIFQTQLSCRTSRMKSNENRIPMSSDRHEIHFFDQNRTQARNQPESADELKVCKPLLNRNLNEHLGYFHMHKTRHWQIQD